MTQWRQLAHITSEDQRAGDYDSARPRTLTCMRDCRASGRDRAMRACVTYYRQHGLSGCRLRLH
eukprot:2332283-Pyramimonas_sp.AAC.1